VPESAVFSAGTPYYEAMVSFRLSEDVVLVGQTVPMLQGLTDDSGIIL
jgi:hypothetical protein